MELLAQRRTAPLEHTLPLTYRLNHPGTHHPATHRYQWQRDAYRSLRTHSGQLVEATLVVRIDYAAQLQRLRRRASEMQRVIGADTLLRRPTILGAPRQLLISRRGNGELVEAQLEHRLAHAKPPYCP